MKILENNALASESLNQWVSSLLSLSDDTFLNEICSQTHWDWDDLDDLSGLSGILNRVDSFLIPIHNSGDHGLVLGLLDFSILILSHVYNKSLYNSVEELSHLLDSPSWSVVYKTLRLFKVLSSHKTFKSPKNLDLMHKLYVLGLGSNLNNPSSVTLQDLCSPAPVHKIPFVQRGDSSEVPEDLKYVHLNRERTNASLDSLIDRPLLVACQLLALSVFLQFYPESSLIQEFCKTLPEIWLLPALSDLIRTSQPVQVQVCALNLIGSIISMLDNSRHEPFNSQLAVVAHDTIASWNSLVLCLLRDLAVPESLRPNNELALGVLELAGIMAECKNRVDISHLPSMTCSLLSLLKNADSHYYYLPIIIKVVRILAVLVPHSIDMFKEVEGFETCVNFCNSQIKLFTTDHSGFDDRAGEKITSFQRSSLIKGLLKVIRIVLGKLELVPGLDTTESRVLVDSGLLNSFKEVFLKNRFEIYEESVIIITHLIGDSPLIVSDLVSNGLILALLDSLEPFKSPVPCTSRFIEILARFLCLVGYNIDGARAIEGNSVVSNMLVALGNIETELISTNTATNIGECLQELTGSIHSTLEKIVEGFIILIQSLQQDITDTEKFFTKVANTGRIFSQTFTINTELLKRFIQKGGFDKLLEVFRIPAIPKYFNNEFYSLTACFKSLPSMLMGQVLSKVIESIRTYYQSLEDVTGTLALIQDFSGVDESAKQGLLHLLTEGDCYLEIIRVILHNWVGIFSNHKDFSELLGKLSHLLRVLISEQARLLCQGKLKDQPCKTLNINFDITVIENQDSKSFEENLYFCYQLTIRRIFRLAMKVPNRTRQPSQEEAVLSICKTLGQIFTENLKVLNLENLNERKVYHMCLQLSDIMKVLLYEQGSSPAIVLTFHAQGGTEIFTNFLMELKKTSFELSASKEFSYHMANGLQILWHLCGKFLETLANGKYLSANYGQLVVKSMGFESSKEVMKKMQMVVLEVLEKVNFFECGKISNYFTKSVIEILKVLCNFTKEKSPVDQKSVKALADMGFSAGVARQALIAIGSNSIEMAMEWIFNHPEVSDLQFEPQAPVPPLIQNLHVKLINAIPYIPSLYSSISDLLTKIALTNESDQDEIGILILFLIGKLVDDLLQYPELKEITAGMTELEDPGFESNYEQLNAALQVLQSLCVKIPEILSIIKGNNFLGHAINFLLKVNLENLNQMWVSSVFSVIDILIKSGEIATVEIVNPVVNILNILHQNPGVELFKESDLLVLLNLLNTITFSPHLAKEFLDQNGLKSLLLTKFTKSEVQNKNLITAWTSLIKQLCEDPLILQSSFEMSFLLAVQKRLPLESFFKNFKNESERSPEIFNKAFENACIVVRRQEVYVEKRRDRNEVTSERWNTVAVLAEVLCAIFELEQKGETGYFTTTEKLVNVFGEVFQAYPRLINDFLNISLPLFDPITESCQTKPLLTQLVKVIIPFKFIPKLEKEKLMFFYPNSKVSVTSAVYQNWIKSSVKLLRVTLLRQTYKNPDSPLSETFVNLVLDGNSGVVKARKMLIKEFKDIFVEQLKKPWFDNEKSLTLIRCTATLLMQILREPPKLPFTPNGCVELARVLMSDKYSITKYLSESIKGVNLSFKKSNSVLNLLMAPLELLTKYSLNFALKSYKPAEYSDAPIEVFHESSHSEENSIEQEEEEDDEEVEDQEEDSADSQDDHDHDQLNDIVIESWNTEQFWADDLEEEEQEFPRRVENRNLHMIMAERALLEQENVQPYLNYRSIFRDLEENLPNGLMWSEFENDDLLQMLLHRNRISNREEIQPEPAFQRTFPESADYLRQLSAYYSGIALDSELVEEVKEEVKEEIKEEIKEVEPEEQKIEIPQENVEPPRMNPIPEGIDPAIFEELPEEIRNEILSQYQRPPRDEGLNEDFLQAMPLEIRNELLMQQRAPQRPVQDVDNATFIATLTPELRREVLLGANEDFLNTLPPDLVAEARALQDRYVPRDYLHGRQPYIKKKQVAEEDKTISTISADEKLSSSLPVCDDNLLEIFLKMLYLATPVNRDILNSLFIDLSAQPINRSKIIDSLLSLLITTESKGDLPPSYLHGTESFLENYSKVYAITSIRIIDVLQQLVSTNPRIALDLVNINKYRLNVIKAIKPDETFGFQDLISLMDQNLFRTSTSHLTPLITLLSSIVQKLDNKIPSLNQITVDRICSLLSFESLNEATVKSVVEIVTKLSSMESNKQQVVQALKSQLTLIGKELLQYIEKNETSVNGLKEVQLLRICKVIVGVYELTNEIDFLWVPLSEALSSITQKESHLASTTNPMLTRLLPLIESFFISHYSRQSSESFHRFSENHSKLINLIIKQNPNLLYETFSSLISKFPYLLDFENKRIYFKTELKNFKRDRVYDNISLKVRRHEVFMDSFHQLKNKTPAEMHGKLRVTMIGEEGLDAGGVTREWYGLLSREMFNLDYALFKLSANGVSFQPNPNSSINAEHIQFFKFVGRIIGKALCDGHPLDVYFTRSFYKHILGQEVTYQDMEDLDVDFYKSLKFLMDINLDDSDLHEYYFAYEEEEFGVLKMKDLVPNGRTKRVTESNKMDYIKLLCAAKMTKNIQAQIEAFKVGFNEMVPSSVVAIFDSKELELLISGLPTVDLDDLKANTEYHNYTQESPVILWFWEVLNEFSREERAEFIQFVTGSSKVPIDGFKALPGIGGFQKFQIHKCFASVDRLPTAHTCMNQLDLPEYTSKEQLKHLLKMAITEGKEGFGFV